MQIPFEEVLKALLAECYIKRILVFIMFFTISLSLLAIGSVWPKRYTAFSIIQIDETSVLQSLMRGTAETTRANDHTANAREIINGEIIMNELLKDAGWLVTAPSEIEQEQIKQNLKKQIEITGIGDGLLKIAYRDNDPSRAFLTAKRLAELFIYEGEKSKSKESKAAFDFIEKQVNTYLEKLTKVETDLREFRSNNPDTRPGLETEVSARISRFQRNIEQAQLDLREAEIRSQSLDRQLSGEAAITISQSKEGQYRVRIAALQEEQERLKLDYTDSYPDIVRLEHQITDLKRAMREEIQKIDEAKKTAQRTGGRFIDESILLNPIYQQLRSRAAATETEMSTLKIRISEMKKLLKLEFSRAKNIHGGEATLAQLTRNYEVNQGIYQDLLRRRENARVSKSLDEERSGLTFEIQEPAKLPLIPTGLRFLHFAIAGLILGLLIPIAGIMMLLQMDPRIRFSQILASEMELPVLAEFRKISSYSELNEEKRSLIFIAIGMASVLLFYGYVSWLKLTGKF